MFLPLDHTEIEDELFTYCTRLAVMINFLYEQYIQKIQNMRNYPGIQLGTNE